jgi:hypothetical protein
MQNVNLLGARHQPTKVKLGSGAAVAALAVAAGAVLVHGLVERQLTQRAVVSLSPSNSALESTSAASASEGDVAQVTPTQQPPAELITLRQQLAQSEALAAALRGEPAMPQAPATTLAQIVAALPQTMWLTEIDLSGARDLHIAGGTLEPQALTAFAQRLAESHTLRGVGLQTLRLEPLSTSSAGAEDGESGMPAPSPIKGHAFVLASTANAASPEAGR